MVDSGRGDAKNILRQTTRRQHGLCGYPVARANKSQALRPDSDEKCAIELNNSALTSIKDFQIPNPDLTVTVNRSDIEKMLLGAARLDQLASAGKVRLEGNARPLEQLKGMVVQFDIGFEILAGTMPAKVAVKPEQE